MAKSKKEDVDIEIQSATIKAGSSLFSSEEFEHHDDRKIFLKAYEKILIERNRVEAFSSQKHLSHEKQVNAIEKRQISPIKHHQIPDSWFLSTAGLIAAQDSDAAAYILFKTYQSGSLIQVSNALRMFEKHGLETPPSVLEHITLRRDKRAAARSTNFSRKASNDLVELKDKELTPEVSRDTATKDITTTTNPDIPNSRPPDLTARGTPRKIAPKRSIEDLDNPDLGFNHPTNTPQVQFASKADREIAEKFNKFCKSAEGLKQDYTTEALRLFLEKHDPDFE